GLFRCEAPERPGLFRLRNRWAECENRILFPSNCSVAEILIRSQTELKRRIAPAFVSIRRPELAYSGNSEFFGAAIPQEL
ncbi:hypothetical protein, partial [Streptomyces sp. NPDC055039]